VETYPYRWSQPWCFNSFSAQLKSQKKTDEMQDVPDAEGGGDESKPHVSFVNKILAQCTFE